MPGSLLDLLAVVLVVIVLRASPRVVLGVLAAAVLLLPGPLVVPHTGSSFLTLHHVLVLAGLGRLVLGLLDGSLQRSHLRLTRVHAALLVLLAVAFVGGVAIAADSGPLGAAGFRLADLADGLGFFSVALVLTRQVGARAALSAAGLGLLLGIGVAGVEYLTGQSYGHVLFSRLPDQQSTSAAFPLSARGGQLRVRAGAEFALQFAWIVVALTPALLVTALRRRGGAWFAAVAAALAVLVVYWSYSRTALGGVVVAVCLTAVLSRQRLLVALGGAGAAIALGGYLLLPSIAHLDSSVDVGSIRIRSLRLAPVMELVSYHPFRGAGLGQLLSSGFPTTDNAFLLEYVELGALGVLALMVVLLVGLTQSARSLLVVDPEDRLVAAACFVGILAFVVSCFVYDAATLVQGTHSLWLLAAIATALGEQRLSPRVAQPRGMLLRRAVAACLVGVLAGLVTYALAPKHTAQRAFFTTLPLGHEAGALFDPVTAAERLLNTVCGVVTTAHLPHVSVDCTDAFGAAGVGQWRVQARTPGELQDAVRTLTGLVSNEGGVRYLHVAPLELPRTGRDSWARTAPVWAPLGLLILVSLLWPSRRLAPEPGQLPPAHGPAPSPRDPERRAELVAGGR